MKNFFSCVLLLLPVNVFGQPTPPSGWERVQALTPGTRVRVAEVSGSRVGGSVVNVSPDSITVSVNGQAHELATARVRKIETPSSLRRVLRVIGIPAGVIAGFMACPSCPGEGGEDLMRRNVMIGAAGGAATWLICPYRTVYEAR